MPTVTIPGNRSSVSCLSRSGSVSHECFIPLKCFKTTEHHSFLDYLLRSYQHIARGPLVAACHNLILTVEHTRTPASLDAADVADTTDATDARIIAVCRPVFSTRLPPSTVCLHRCTAEPRASLRPYIHAAKRRCSPFPPYSSSASESPPQNTHDVRKIPHPFPSRAPRIRQQRFRLTLAHPVRHTITTCGRPFVQLPPNRLPAPLVDAVTPYANARPCELVTRSAPATYLSCSTEHSRPARCAPGCAAPDPALGAPTPVVASYFAGSVLLSQRI